MPKQLRFVHITKNAGTTIEEIGKPHWGRFDAEYRDAVSDVYGSPWDWWHIPPQFMSRDALSAIRKKYDFFLVVRNPFDRVVSEYYCEWGGPKKKWNDAARANSWIQQQLEKIEQSIEVFEANKAAGGKRQPGRTYKALDGHWMPQHIYTVDENGGSLVESQNVVRFENLAADFSSLMSRYNYPDTFSIEKASHLNKSRAKVGQGQGSEAQFTAHQLSPENIELVRRIYRRDFEQFNYSLDPPPPKPKPVPPPTAPQDDQYEGPQSKRARERARDSPPPPAAPVHAAPTAPTEPPAPPAAPVPVVPVGKQSLSSLLAAYTKRS
jgi:hypothetical protein